MSDDLAPEFSAVWFHTTETTIRPSRLSVDMLTIRLLVAEYKLLAFYKRRETENG